MKLKLKINRKYIFAFLAFLLLIFSVITVIFSLRNIDLDDASVADAPEYSCKSGERAVYTYVNAQTVQGDNIITVDLSRTGFQDYFTNELNTTDRAYVCCPNPDHNIVTGQIIYGQMLKCLSSSPPDLFAQNISNIDSLPSSTLPEFLRSETDNNSPDEEKREQDTQQDGKVIKSEEVGKTSTNSVGPAYLTGFGVSCRNNYASCGTDKINVIEGLSEGKIKTYGNETTPGKVIAEINRLYGESANNICLPNNIKDVIQTRGRAQQGDSDFSLFFNYCPAEYSASQTQVSGFGGGWDIHVCCPSGYQAATTENTADFSGNNYQREAVCCAIPQGAVKGGSNYPYLEVDGVCGDKNNDAIIYPSNDNRKKIINYDEQNIAGFELATTADKEPEELTGSLDIISNKGAQQICPDNYNDGCALATNGTIIDPNTLRESKANACFRCFENQQAIRLVDVEGSTEQKLQICDSTQEGRVRNVELINGNVQDTLAYLKADAANQPLLQACREGGGIYIAIGCVDPSPIGIIAGLIRLAFGVMGGVALIQLILAGIAYQQGDEGKIEEAKERVIATISGLAVLIFSVLILEILGVNILDVLPA